MHVFWLQQSVADIPATDDWLTESEATRLNSFRFAKRRADWRLGRWTAKRAVAACLELPNDASSLRKIEIIPASTGQPEVTLCDRAETVTISISHRQGIAICAVARGTVQLGCDLEIVELRSDAFIADYFTMKEQELIARTTGDKRTLLVALLWSAKESALKALHVGLRADTRSVEVAELGLSDDWSKETDEDSPSRSLPAGMSDISRSTWRPLQVQCADGTALCGWWQRSGNNLRTIVASPPPAPPVELQPQFESG
jgi:4'-phosphopantetheinyl transferase